MLPRLILLRHAKSDWPRHVPTDFDRPLAPQGQRDLPLIAEAIRPYLTAKKIHCLCSPAKRTMETLELAKPYWPDIAITYPSNLYGASVTCLMELIRSCSNNSEIVIVIGHNPGLSHLLQFCLTSEHSARLQKSTMPTSCAAIIKLPIIFSQLSSGIGQLEAFFKPKQFKE